MYGRILERTLEKHKLYLYVGGSHTLQSKEAPSKISKQKVAALVQHYPYTDSYFWVSRLFKIWFVKDIPYLRAFYPLLYNLEDVLRFDAKSKSYYKSRY